jgi:hypothetical protein
VKIFEIERFCEIKKRNDCGRENDLVKKRDWRNKAESKMIESVNKDVRIKHSDNEKDEEESNPIERESGGDTLKWSEASNATDNVGVAAGQKYVSK